MDTAKDAYPAIKTLRKSVSVMSRTLLILPIAILLVGCPVTFNANLKNESTGPIVFIPPFRHDYRVEIGESETERTRWYQDCITIIDGDRALFFKGWPVPSNVIQTHIFSSSLNVVYKESQLYFENKEGNLYPVKQVSQCGQRP